MTSVLLSEIVPSVKPVSLPETLMLPSLNVSEALLPLLALIELIPVNSEFKLNLTTPSSAISAFVLVPLVKLKPVFNFVFFLLVSLFAV